MGLFYAYLKDELVDKYGRCIITFANRETADEWWRMISTSPSPYAGNVKRISPQFYTQTHHMNVIFFFSHNDLPNPKRFLKKMFFTGIGNTDAETIPPIAVTDHISGQWYFLRSKADPWSHWYFRVDGPCLVCGDTNCDAIHVSSEYRTKFCIQVRNTANDIRSSEDLVMIGSDEISVIAPENYTIHIDDAGNLKATKRYQGGTDLQFRDLKNRLITRAEKRVNGEVREYVKSAERGMGEAWELVD